ncbi:hypothetical protein VTJ04DRAFT_2091 [Mycothermus thermophilus]|uniref:uncharacterized protein n=1 Tax=Humicola insolens TaxID=85995 RepID=UPI003741F917
MSDTESSDDLGFVAEGLDSDESSGEESSSDGVSKGRNSLFDLEADDTDEDGPDSDNLSDEGPNSYGVSEGRNGLFDLEADDTDEETSDENEEGGIDWSFGVIPEGHTFFPQFMKLPIELRFRVWEYICPELTGNGRVVSFNLRAGYSCDPWVDDSMYLDQTTVRVRLISAVHRESRQLAIKAFPDILNFGPDHEWIVRFNARKDVIGLSTMMTPKHEHSSIFWKLGLPSIPGFSERVRHLKIFATQTQDVDLQGMFDNFPNLEAVYRCTPPPLDQPELLRWCVSDRIKSYCPQLVEDNGIGNERFFQFLYCLPNLAEHRDFAETQIPLQGLLGTSAELASVKADSDCKVWPLIRFEDRQIDFIEHLKTWDGKEDLSQYIPEESDLSSESDEYESSGIDDSEISDHVGSDIDYYIDSEGEIHQISSHEDEPDINSDYSKDDSEQASLNEDDLEAADQGSDEDLQPFSPIQDSSPSSQHSPATSSGSDAAGSGSDSEGTPAPKTKRPRTRRVVADSDDEEEEEDMPRKRARKRARIVDSDDDDSDDDEEEDDDIPQKRRKRARIIQESDDDASSDSEHPPDDDPSEEEWSGISGSDDESESSEAETRTRPMSLIERLQLHRERHPIPSTDDEDSDKENRDEDESVSSRRSDFDDDDDDGSEDSSAGYGDTYDGYGYGEDDEIGEDEF